MEGGKQLKLLLWKDYLTRKRKLITLGGVIWATGIMLSLYIVRINVDNEDYPACQFPARAMPSAGVFTFLQSFICSVNNECSPMDKYEEIPSYENSTLTKLHRKLSPIMNDTILEVTSSVPDALKLLSTLAAVVDQPSFIRFTENGLRVEDLYKNPSRVKRYIASQLNITDEVSQSILTSDISLQGIIKGKLNKCDAESLSQVLRMNDTNHFNILVKSLCSISNDQIQTMLMELLTEIDFNKYIKMFGDIYNRLTGDNRLNQLGDMLTSVMRMKNLRNFLPPEVAKMVYGEAEFSYFPLSLISKLMDLFEPTFGETESFRSLQDFSDGAVLALQYVDKIFAKPANGSNNHGLANIGQDGDVVNGFKEVTNIINNAVNVLESTEMNKPLDVFNVLSRVTAFIYKFLSNKNKHDLLFYSTLVAKLMESAQRVIDINSNVEQIAYNVTQRNSKAIEVLTSLPPYVVGKAFDALADTDRVQILTSKINYPGQMFCDANKIASFFVVSVIEAENVKKKLCTDVWKNYASDLIQSFGIFDVRSDINNMASLLIQETLGQDTTGQLYTIEKVFKILEDFIYSMEKIELKRESNLNWDKMFKVPEDSELMKVMKNKGHLGKQILITIHGALAKEVVKQNAILEFKITPILLDMTTFLEALYEELDAVPDYVTRNFETKYGEVLETVLRTAFNEEKTYRSLSTNCEDIFCYGVDNAEIYLELPIKSDKTTLVSSLCEVSRTIVNGMTNTSTLAKAIKKISTTNHNILEGINWTRLINSIKQLYNKLQNDYPYLFDYTSYGMEKQAISSIERMRREAKIYWFSVGHLYRTLHLSIKLGLRLLDILNQGIFDITDPMWLKMKYVITTSTGPLNVFDDTIKLVTALLMKTNYTSELPPITVNALNAIVTNIPRLIKDSIDVIVKGDTDINPIITIMNTEPAWPCSDVSISELLELSPGSKEAVKAIERLLCMEQDLQVEWVEYLTLKRARVPNYHDYNTTRFEPHVYLNFSAAFDSLLDDFELIKKTFQYILNDGNSDELNIVSAWEYAIKAVNVTDKNIISKFLNKLDTVLNAISTSTVDSTVTLKALLNNYFKCSNATYITKECREVGRTAWKYTFKTFSIIFDNIAMDLLTYFTEINDPDSNILQMAGFTKDTGLYMLYDRIGDFVGVLLDSYWDFDFMNQVRRAALTSFWDCEAIVSALKPAPDSPIDKTAMDKIKPFVCPTFLYWLSMPRGANKLLDLVSKPQYYFYTHQVQNVTSTFESSFSKMVQVADLISDMVKKNSSHTITEKLKLPNLRAKLKSLVETILNYKVHSTDPGYKLFSKINQRQFAINTYLTRIVTIINKMAIAVENFNIEEVELDDKEEIKANVTILSNLYKRRTVDMIYIHFDAINDVLWNNKVNHTFVEALENICDDLETNNTDKYILPIEKRTKSLICTLNYKVLYKAVHNLIVNDYENTSKSLNNLLKLFDNESDVIDIFKFFKNRTDILESLKTNIQYSYELGLPLYLKYLQYNLQGYNIILTFLSGGDWWTDLKQLYNGPYSRNFFSYLENSFEAVENILTNVDRIHLVRLLRDINVNETSAFCQPNITLSEYIPDSTGMLSDLKQQQCSQNKADLFHEIPSLLIVSQAYEPSLRLPKDINYTSLYADLTTVENKLEFIRNGSKDPQRPPWVTDDRIAKLQTAATGLLSKETLIKIGFGVLGNIVDAGTLFLNSSECTLCSQFTTWFKQLDLQLYKKEEYDNLLCHMDSLTIDDIYYNLHHNFHWDMAIEELLSTRNYTKYELNKSINEFLELMKLHLLEDITANSTKLDDCLVKNAMRNGLGNATLFINVVTRTARMFRAELPHIREVSGITELPYIKQMLNEIAHNLDVYKPLKQYLIQNNTLNEDLMRNVLDTDLIEDIEGSAINLRRARSIVQPTDDAIYSRLINWRDICEDHNCSKIASVIISNLNASLVANDLPDLQVEEFWHFNFISDVIHRAENILDHGSHVLEVASAVDIQGAAKGQLEPLLNMMMTILMDENIENLITSLEGIGKEIHPLFEGKDLENDLDSLAVGLNVIYQFKNYLLEEEDLKLEVSKLFPDFEAVESSLNALGINNTNFWSLAAPRIYAGYIQIKPIFSYQRPYRISDFVCQIQYMEQVIIPSNLDVVSNEEVLTAVAEQFCGIDDERAKQILPVLLGNFNFSIVFEKVKTNLLSKLYTASDLTEEEGETLLSKLPQMAALLPAVQDNVGDISDMLAKEPLLNSLKDFTSVGNLVSSSDFMSNAGKMLCGKPFATNIPRLLKNILNNKDNSGGPTQAQLNVFPTDYCRSLYKDIMNVEGGKIVWSFVKPLIVGKILYTPLNPTVNRIIEKANVTFATMIKMTDLVHSFAKAFPSLDKLSEHRNGLTALKNLVTNPNFEEFRSMIIGDDIQLPDMEMDGLFDQFGDVKGFGSIFTKASNLLECFNLNRFRGTPNEYQLTHDAAELTMANEFSAGIVFMNTENQNGDLNNVEYKIRMDIENVPTTSRKKGYLWIPGPESNFIENMRYFRGFVQIQDIIDTAIIKLSSDSTKRRKRDIHEKFEWASYTQQIPYPCYRKDFYQTSLYESQTLIVGFFFALLFTVSSAVRYIVIDKETGNTMLMSVMGVDLCYHTLSWFVASFLEMVVTVGCVTLVLHYGMVVPRTDPTLIFALLFLFGISVLSFCYMTSKLFGSASIAAVCTAIAYLSTFMPFVMILSLEAVMVSSLKLLVCLFMSSSLCYAFLYITRYEAMGAGAQWADLWSSPIGSEDMSIGLAALMIIVDAAIYFAIGCLIDRYFGLKTLRSNITNCNTTEEKAGVSILNVTKIYGEGTRRAKLALDNVSIELRKGQITTLLGHNGAGKTTLINILTGMVKPSKGHVVIRSDSESGTKLGVCPQRDVLFHHMTAKEHVQFYAQLNSSLTAAELSREVDRMLEVLSLGAWSEEPVLRLSGGTRRRVCVALAFIAKPHLVSLDEPTSGVDPAARRDIWSMIVKLKEDRTILLTTHHLDEAELLSDQIVIMHKGQIHTTGSPIEIKRSLGNGYKLTVMYPEKTTDECIEDSSIEEKTKQLLAVTRNIVKNANVQDVNGLEVEISLPFYDADGLNNDFLRLCSVLENSEVVLGFRSFSLDCSSLEQVFFDICQQADAPELRNNIQYGIEESPSSTSKSTVSVRAERAPLVSPDGPLRGSCWEQFLALMHARYIHHIRNRWLLFILVILPTLFVTLAMGFSMLRPPADNEIALKLDGNLYNGSTEFLVAQPSVYPDSNNLSTNFAERVMHDLEFSKKIKNWTLSDSPICECVVTRQTCDIDPDLYKALPEMMSLPDVDTLNNWLLDSQEVYIEKRYGGFTSTLRDNLTNFITWYNNKGHHALPAYLNVMNSAILKAVVDDEQANITVYTHPLKISEEKLSKDTVYQHIADAGISCLVLIGYSLVSAGAAIYLVSDRTTQQKRLQLLCGVTPALYWTTALTWDIMIIVINMAVTAIVMLAFGFPVFVARNNLPAICILIILYGYACGNLIHVAEKLFREASLANMMLFCSNTFFGLAGITILLILDVISESDATDNARWILHKVFMLSPQFALGDGLLEIAKNTIQAQVLLRFGMDTYRDPFRTDLMMYHYSYLVVVGTLLLLFNLAIEYDCFETILVRLRRERIPEPSSGELEPVEVTAERKRVRAARLQPPHVPLRVSTLGNINRGFVPTEYKKNSMQNIISMFGDVVQCVDIGKVYPSTGGQPRVAVRSLTLGIPAGQCTALLGQNGAGKSTTFAMLTGEIRPTVGQIYLNDKKVNPRQLCQGLISYCPQSDAIDPLMTVRETLQFYCRLRGITDQDKVIKRTLELFELVRYAEVRNGTLSGGNKRKLCTAIAFMARTPLVLLDEPTSGMDPGSRACVSRGVRQCAGGAGGAGGRGVLVSTHALEDARRVACRVALMRKGELVALASLDDCLNRFGGGHVVQCRTRRTDPKVVWRHIKSRATHASLRVLHHDTLHFLLPTYATVGKKDIVTRLSDVFRLMAELQATCDIEDYTINQSSLEQMFLSFTDKDELDIGDIDVEPLPTPETLRRNSEELDSITSL